MPSGASSTAVVRARRGPASWRVLAGAHRSDSSALGRAIERCIPSLRRWTHGRFPRWVRSAADTSDLVQDAIVRTLARLDAFQPQGRRALAAYLRKAVRNRIRDEHRRSACWGMPAALPDTLAARSASPFDTTLRNETERRYRMALARLKQRDRELIVAHIELDYSHEQLGCMIGRSPHAARMALCRAIERLAALMRDS